MKTRRNEYPLRSKDEKRNDRRHLKVSNLQTTKVRSSLSNTRALNFSEETQNLFRQARYRFKRRRIRCYYPNEILFSDSIVYRQYGRQNSGFNYIVVVVDCFSKKAYGEAVKKLDEFNVTIALEKIFKRLPDLPRYFVTDRGTEFLNSKVRAMMERNGVIQYQMRGRHKASIAERFIRTLKSNLEKYFWQNRTKRWIDVFQAYIEKYNASYHRSIRMKPDEVNWDNRRRVFQALFPETIDKSFPRLPVGTKVRLIKFKHLLEKGYTRRWSLQIYTIIRSESRSGVDYYRIADLEGNIVPGSKYYWELNPISNRSNARLRDKKRRMGNSSGGA